MRSVLFISAFVFFQTAGFAQRPLEVITQVAMPFPNEFDELLEDYSFYTFTVINYSYSDQELYFLADLIGDNGVTMMTSRDYKPPAPFHIAARETVMLTGLDLENLNPGITTNEVEIEGLNPIHLAQGTIPEGIYQFCINVFDFTTGEQLSSGCSFPFNVGNGDVPAIITPFEGEVIPSTEIPAYLISWEPPASNPADASQYEYILKMVDLTTYQDLDLEEVFQDGGVAVHLEREVIGYQYFYNAEGDDPPMIYGHQYAVRVQVIDPMNSVEFENGGYSEIRTFWYGEMSDFYENENEEEESQQQQELPADCFSRCNLPEVENITQVTDPAAITTLKMGHFYIEQFQLTPFGDGFNGEGEIVLDFLQHLRVRVMLNGIRVNDEGKIFDGSITGIQDDIGGIGDFMEYVSFGAVGDGIAMSDNFIPADVSAQIGNYLQEARMISALAGYNNIGLPIGFSETILGNEFTLGITDLIITPHAAKAKLVAGLNLALFEGDNWLMFIADSLCIHPSGFGGEYELSLGSDLVLNNESENAFELIFKGATGPAQQSCRLLMNCEGIQSCEVAGELHFARNVIVPELEDGTIGEEKAKAYFHFSLQTPQGSNGEETVEEPASSGQGSHWIAGLTMDRFQIPRLKGWTFEINEAYWDMSEMENPDQITFPPDYHTTGSDFAGIWIKSAMIAPPDKLCSGQRTSVQVSNLFLDPNLYCQIDAHHLLRLGEGNIDGWGIGLDLFHLDIWNNELLEARLEGELQIPLLDTSSSVLFTGLIGQGEGEEGSGSPGDGDYSYHFNFAFSEDVKFNFMIAEGFIADDSYLDLQFSASDEGESYAHVVLHGEMTVNTEALYPDALPELPADIQLPDMEYSIDYHSSNGFNVSGTYIGFASPQKNISGFPINMTDFEVGLSMTDEDEVSVDFDVLISLAQDQTDFAAGVHFSLISNLTTMSILEEAGQAENVGEMVGVVKTLRLNRVALDSVTLDIEMSKLAIQGRIHFYNEPLPQGEGRDKGIRGDVSVTLPVDGVTGSLTAIFGNSGNPELDYGPDFFSYWYVRGLLTFPGGIPLGSTGIGLYGLGGGIGKNMRQVTSPVIQQGQITGEPVYEPEFGAFRMEFTSILGTVPRPEAFNADITFIAQFVNGGLDMIGIEGDGYIMTPIDERADPQVYAGLDVYMYLGNSERDFSIDGNIRVAINIADGVLRGNMQNSQIPNQLVNGIFHADPSTFFFYMGEPDMDVYDENDPRGSALLTIEGIMQAQLKTYMMVGHGIPTELPPLPLAIQQILNNPEGSLGGTADASTAQGQLGGVDYESGAGFAHGSYAEITADIDALLIYATLAVYLGYDMNITRRTSLCANTGNQIGINGWYAEGQAYAGLTGGMGLRLKMFGEQREFELFQLAAAIALAGGGPNPFYFTGRASVAYSILGGKIKGSSTFSMMIGERCSPMLNDPLAGINFYEIVEPEPGEEEVFVGTALHAKFVLPMSEVITIPQPVEDENGVITHSINLRYRPEVTYSFKKVAGNVSVPLQSPMWTDDRTHGEFYMLPGQALEPNRQYDFSMSIKAWDYQTNAWLQVDGQTWSQDTVVRFKTGALPPDLYNWVTYTVPLPMERYFLQKEQPVGKIYFSTAIDEDYYFPATGQSPLGQHTFNYQYYIRFTNLENVTETEIPFTYFENNYHHDYGLTFSIPALDHSAVYALQVIRKNPHQAAQPSGKGSQEIVLASLSQNDVNTSLTMTTAASVPPGEILGAGEFLLYHTYFRTSEFDYLRDKLGAATVDVVNNLETNSNQYGRKLEIELTLAESFEKRDFQKFSPASPAYQFMEFEPRVRALDLFLKPFHNQHAEPRLEDFRSYYVDDVQNAGFFLPWPDDQLKLVWENPVYRIPKPNIQTSLKDPLTPDEVAGLWSSYTTGTPYFNIGSLQASSFIEVSDIQGQNLIVVNPLECRLIYDTHYKVSQDRKKVLDWSAAYMSTWSPHYYTFFSNAFQQHAPGFLTRHEQLQQSNLKLQNHPGSYDLKFSRNIATKPGEELYNIFTMYNLGFSTPSLTGGSSGFGSRQ